jgi:hypothetical protein
VSAKQSYIVSIWMKRSKHGKTLQPCSEESMYNWKRIYIKRLDKVTLRVQHKSSGCNESERKGSLVKIKDKMDELVFDERSQYDKPRVEKGGLSHLRGISGDMNRQKQYGTWETLASKKDLSYKEAKWIRVGRESDETIVPMMIVQDNAIVGKGLC